MREGAETACSWRRSGRSGRPRLPAMSPIARGPIGRPRLKFRRGLCRCFGVGTGARSGPDTETPTTFSISATTAGGAGATGACTAGTAVRAASTLSGDAGCAPLTTVKNTTARSLPARAARAVDGSESRRRGQQAAR